MFYGEYSQILDNKNRMRIPAKLRALIEGDSYIMDGAEHCLIVINQARFEQMSAVFASIPLSDKIARAHASEIMRTVMKIEEDAQGRFVLGGHALKHSGITKNITVIGNADVIEIWAEEVLTARNAEQFENADSGDHFEALEGYGF